MTSIYLPKSVHERLKRFIAKSRISPQFGSPKRFKSPYEAVSFLLKIGEKYGIETLEEIVKQVFYCGELTEETFDRDVKTLKEEAKKHDRAR